MKSNFDRSKIGKMPAGWIPGISRGCHGFITRSDIGPMMADITSLARDHAIAQQKERERIRESDREGETAAYNDINFDNWDGFQNERLFKSADYDEEDKEADEIYQIVDNYVASRAGKDREARVSEELEKLKKRNPTAKDALKDVLKDISKMSRQDWMEIPEANGTYKRARREEKYTPVPDSLISDRLRMNTLGSALDTRANVRSEPATGVQSVVPGNLSAFGDARRTILGLSLDHTVGGQKSSLNKAGYITALNSSLPTALTLGAEIHDLTKAKELFKSMIESNPLNPKSWQGAARIMELDGNIEEARNIIAQGVEKCPDSEDVWFEAIRLEEKDKQKPLAAKAVITCPKSTKLWLVAASLEADRERRCKVLKKALQSVPQSDKLWKELIDTATDDQEAIDFLTHAVECVPDSLDFHLALARLLPYKEAKEVINKANQHFKSEERAIWVHASKLEEANGNADKCGVIISRGIQKTAKKKQVFEREEWLDEAQQCEKAGCPHTCRAIVKAVYVMDAKEQERVGMWLEDAQLAIQRGHKSSAKFMFECALEDSPESQQLWDSFILFSQRTEDSQAYLQALTQASSISSKAAEGFLLRLTKELIRAGRAEEAQQKMADALQRNPGSEVVALAFVEQLKQTGQLERARAELQRAQQSLKSAAVWRYSVKLERDLGDINKALECAKKACEVHPYDVDLACDLCTVFEELNKFELARENYLSLTRNPRCQRSSRPWVQFMRLEEKLAGAQKARTIYESSRKHVHGDAEMWYQVIKLEERAGQPLQVLKSLLSDAIRECPKNGELLGMLVEIEPKAGRIRVARHALESCEYEIEPMNVLARIFWLELKKEKATTWFERSLLVNPLVGDTWAYYYLFLQETGEDAQKQQVLQRCVQAEPREGRLWKLQSERPVHWSFSTEQLLLLVVEEARKNMARLRK